MGRIAKLLSFVRTIKNGAKVSTVKFDPGGGANVTAEHFADAGDDAHPLTTDYVSLNNDSGSGREKADGYFDPINTPKSAPGEKRIYGRDSDSGLAVVEVWLKSDGTAQTLNDKGSTVLSPDGSIKGSNSAGSFELQAGGDFVVNGVIIDTDGNITSPSSVSAPSIVANGKELAGHGHNILSGSSAPGPTGPNN